MSETVASILEKARDLSPNEKRDLARELFNEAFDQECFAGKTIPVINTLEPIPENVCFDLQDEGENAARPRVVAHSMGMSAAYDVFEIAEASACAIAHPAILAAIRRWESTVLRCRHLQLRREGSAYKKAAENLKKLGKALLAGAKDRALSKEEAFALFVKTDKAIVSLKYAYEIIKKEKLHVINDDEMKWQRLFELMKKRHEVTDVPDIDGDWETEAQRVEDKAMRMSCGTFIHLAFWEQFDVSVLNYFKSTRGEVFLCKESIRWETLRDDFISWRYDLDMSLVRQYRTCLQFRLYLAMTHSSTLFEE